jgi:hypothetical protein
MTLYDSFHSLLDHERLPFCYDERRIPAHVCLTNLSLIFHCSLTLWLSSTIGWLLRFHYVPFHKPGADRKRFVCCNLCIRCRGNMFTKPLSSNGLFRDNTGTCLAKDCLEDGHIPAFRRHITVYYDEKNEGIWTFTEWHLKCKIRILI